MVINLRNSLLVMRREFLERVRKKSFVIMTLLTPVFFIALMVGPSLLFMVKGEKVPTIAVLDETGWMQEALLAKNSGGVKKEAFAGNGRFEKAPAGATLESLQKRLAGGDKTLDGVLLVQPAPEDSLKAVLYAQNIGNPRLAAFVENRVNDAFRRRRLKEMGVSSSVMEVFSRSVSVEKVKIEKGGKAQAGSFLAEYLKAILFSMLLYMLIVTYGMTLMRGVMEEKNGKIAEVLLSTLRPFELVMGKVVGIASVGLVQYFIWFLMGLALVLANPMNFLARAGSAMVGPVELAVLVVFYLLGFFFYASIYTAIGSVCTTDQEAQQLQMPVIMCLIMPMIVLGAVIQDPNATWVAVLSIIPFFSPTLMVMRFSLVSVPVWQLVASLGGLAVGTVVMAWIGGKVFSVGILMTGKRPSIPEILRWIRAA